jgi:nitroreductase
LPDTAIPGDAERLLHARYRMAAEPHPPAWNEVLAGLLAHRTVRAYLPDKLPPGTLETLVAAAQSASTSSNLQTWSVVAVEDPARKSRLADLAGGQAHIREAPLFLIWLADLSRLETIGRDRQIDLPGLRYLESFVLGVIDAALAAQNAMMALESLGHGACYIGAIRNKPLEVAAELSLPPNVFAVFGMTVGTPDPARPADIKPRLPQPVVLHREQYGAQPSQAVLDGYDDALLDFEREQGMALDRWTDKVLGRVKSAKSLTGRDVLRQALNTLGFPLQ